MSKVIAYMLCVTMVGKEHETAEKLRLVTDVKEVDVVYGEFDILVTFESVNWKALDSSITKVRKITEIIRTLTLIAG